jgi:hypothetical protein
MINLLVEVVVPTVIGVLVIWDMMVNIGTGKLIGFKQK